MALPSGFPPTLEAFLDERLPQFNGALPDEDWISDIAQIYDAATTAVGQAVRAWKPKAAPVVLLRPVERISSLSEESRRDPQAIYGRIVSALRSQGCLDGGGTKHGPSKTIARCPLHRDRRPSLNVTWNEQGAALFCHSCHNTAEILNRLGLTTADLCSTRWGGGRERAVRSPREVARYVYADLHGTVLAEKVRFDDKSFRFCRPGPHGDIWNLKGVTLGLYRVGDLIGSPVLYVTEGEKSVDQLWTRGLPASCGPFGASRKGWWMALSQAAYDCAVREFYILPDHDEAGAAHGETVAAMTAALALALDVPLTIKVVQPYQGKPTKLNAVDWLLDGHTDEDLDTVIAQTPVWTPNWREEARRARRRQQQREWVEAKRRGQRGEQP